MRSYWVKAPVIRLAWYEVRAESRAEAEAKFTGAVEVRDDPPDCHYWGAEEDIPIIVEGE